MTRGPRSWTCQRVTRGRKCGTTNPARRVKCAVCGKRKPARRKPAHMAVLAETYEIWVQWFGPKCGICGRLASARRRLDRDHDHRTGRPRGLLCARCNRALPNWVTSEWLRAAAAYLERGSNSQVEVEVQPQGVIEG